MVEDSSSGHLVRRYLFQMKEMYGNDLYFNITDFPGIQPASYSLAEFDSDICNCRKCSLSETRTKFVFGVGNPKSDIVFIGEAPGRNEDLQGEPFVGRAGQLLDKILAAIQYTRDQVYICNILKCRPPNNRTPSGEEIKTCLPYLNRQLELIQPGLIVALGATAAHTLLSVKTSLSELRSKMWKWRNFNLVVTYHPAALLRNPGLKRSAWKDFQWIQHLIEEG